MGLTSHIYGNNVYSLKAINHKSRKSRKAKLALTPAQPPVRVYKPDPFFDSQEWHSARYAALIRHGAKCQCCGATRHDNVIIQVDHIKPRSKYPALALDVNNLQVLCKPCNMGKSNKDCTDWRA